MAKETIVQSLTALDDSLSDNALEQYVSRLRRRISPLGLMLRTAQGIGYLLEKPAKDGVSALAIAERLSVDINGGLEVDIPYSSLEMLASTAQDRVFYRVDSPTGIYLTGYENLFVVALVLKATTGFADRVYSETRMRSDALTRSLSTGSQYIAFIVTVTESTRGREALARVIPVRSALRLMVLILSVVSIVWIAVTWALRPLDRLVEEIARRSPDDLHPVQKQAVQEVGVLAGTANSFM